MHRSDIGLKLVGMRRWGIALSKHFTDAIFIYSFQWRCLWRYRWHCWDEQTLCLCRSSYRSIPVRVGFPSPADDHLDFDLDLYRYVVKRPAATYFVSSKGDSIIGSRTHHWDLLMATPRLGDLSHDAFDQLNSAGITKLLCQDLKASMCIPSRKNLISN